jgi:hypothetical protein
MGFAKFGTDRSRVSTFVFHFSIRICPLHFMLIQHQLAWVDGILLHSLRQFHNRQTV